MDLGARDHDHDGFDEGSRTLRFTTFLGDRGDRLLPLLRAHAGILRQLHVEHLSDPATMAAFFEALPSCTCLTAFVFRTWNHVDVLPELESLGQLAGLTTLDLQGCRMLTALPESLGQLTALTTLDLSYCDALTLAGLPESLDQLAALTKLNLHLCRALTGLPESLSRLTTLTSLDLSTCVTLTGLPKSLGQLTALTTLTVCECDALTELPESLGQLAALQQLDASFCGKLSRLPESLGQLSALKLLNVCFCELTLPLSVAFLPDTLDLQIHCLRAEAVHADLPRAEMLRGMPAIKAFLLMRHHPLKILLLILVACRRRRVRRPPNELWVLTHDEFLINGNVVNFNDRDDDDDEQ